jgi:hypothetical protein
MNNSDFGWESLLRSDSPSGCTLKAALFTTYDRAEDCLLAEHVLPELLSLDRRPEAEGAERQYFLLELDRRLKQLNNRVFVVSSTSRDEPADETDPDSGAYAWTGRLIHHVTVGSQGQAVQHAKLWMLHWQSEGKEGGEFLELVVSSANLTRAAFRGQIQAVWRACIPIIPRESADRLAGWAVLPEFVRELAKSTGDGTRFDHFLSLLARADCPAGVTFVASVPGQHSRLTLRRTPWGAAGLAAIAPPGRGTVSVAVLSPFIGSWNAETLKEWCTSFGGSPDRLALVWIAKSHPWARRQRWRLPEASLKSLTDSNATLLQLRHETNDEQRADQFHNRHRPQDDRWSHAKIYALKRGISRRILLTSANFSSSAWGRKNADGGLTIQNFELGVCVDQATWPFDELDTLHQRHAATVSETPQLGSKLINWANASWDGSIVHVQCRCQAEREITGEIEYGGERRQIDKWDVAEEPGVHSAGILWTDAVCPPALAHLKCEQESLTIAVFDERPVIDRDGTLPPEVDEDTAQAMSDELLFEQYGGPVAGRFEDPAASSDGEDEVDEGETPPDGDANELKPTTNPDHGDSAAGEKTDDEDEIESLGTERGESYAVPAFVLARRYFQIIDNWAAKVQRSAEQKAEAFERRLLKQDGELLVQALARQSQRDAKKGSTVALGAKLAQEELIIRLKHIPEE